jgi:hypothetical protein
MIGQERPGSKSVSLEGAKLEAVYFSRHEKIGNSFDS